MRLCKYPYVLSVEFLISGLFLEYRTKQIRIVYIGNLVRTTGLVLKLPCKLGYKIKRIILYYGFFFLYLRDKRCFSIYFSLGGINNNNNNCISSFLYNSIILLDDLIEIVILTNPYR